MKKQYRAVVTCSEDPCSYCRAPRRADPQPLMMETHQAALAYGRGMARYVYGASVHTVTVEWCEVSAWRAAPGPEALAETVDSDKREAIRDAIAHELHRMKDGRDLTDADLDALAAEAVRGYDPGQITRVPDLPAETPKAWADLIEALQLLARGQSNEISPLHCEHDKLTVMADPEAFTYEERARLDEWGFHADEEEEGCFYSFRYGSA